MVRADAGAEGWEGCCAARDAEKTTATRSLEVYIKRPFHVEGN
jgi:hypothetical protein